MKIALVLLSLLFGVLIIVEIGLRIRFGFGSPVLYLGDGEIGYLLAPNQKTRRYGNRIEINQYSMRSAAITPLPSPKTRRVLLLGDSLVNGGWWTDQSQTLSALITQQLQPALGTGENLEILNLAANSWGPPNQLAYLQRFGTFGSEVIVLLINTDDLFTHPPNSGVVGRDRNYPDTKPPLALVEVFNRYLKGSEPIPEAKQPQPSDPVGYNLEKIQQIQAIATQNQADFILAMTPLLREVSEPGSRDYEIKARQRLTELTQAKNWIYIDFLPLFKQTSQPETLYRDHIHLSPSGNQLVSEIISYQLTVNSYQ
ncbi:Lipolytic protein G-D-S-L family [Planktothrix serta PCC 8927]|uniref:Lipolytic protein G-D-S-L family n=1 Tax=Planktothrix serta PCC 8927 TaxID=671068 RepID=A0A7Z9DYT6_9CYAN|nr:SGNH/GDSL hydrolase family protein [Planktothrix serta]VXD13933.1 Lipolytic protein G-D-S-L family [Planktothrix serta PCC 8927]